MFTIFLILLDFKPKTCDLWQLRLFKFIIIFQERPERAIYDPRKAAERRQISKQKEQKKTDDTVEEKDSAEK